MQEAQDLETIFGPVISRYTRAQAIEDGILGEVSPDLAREAGFVMPIAMTSAVWEKYVKIPKLAQETGQDATGRLWDILNMLRFAIQRSAGGDTILFKLHVRNDDRRQAPPLVTLKAVCGPGDDMEPVLTIMLPEED